MAARRVDGPAPGGEISAALPGQGRTDDDIRIPQLMAGDALALICVKQIQLRMIRVCFIIAPFVRFSKEST